MMDGHERIRDGAYRLETTTRVLRRNVMRNAGKMTRALIVAVVLAGMFGVRPVKADAGAPGGPNRSTCAFLQGIIYKVGSDAAVDALIAVGDMFGCDLHS